MCCPQVSVLGQSRFACAGSCTCALRAQNDQTRRSLTLPCQARRTHLSGRRIDLSAKPVTRPRCPVRYVVHRVGSVGSCGAFARSPRSPAQQQISRPCLADYAFPDAGNPKLPPIKVIDRSLSPLFTVIAVWWGFLPKITGTENSYRENRPMIVASI